MTGMSLDFTLKKHVQKLTMPSPSNGCETGTPPISNSAGPLRSRVPSRSSGMVPACPRPCQLKTHQSHLVLDAMHRQAYLGGTSTQKNRLTFYHAVVHPEIVFDILRPVALQYIVPVRRREYIVITEIQTL